MLNQARNEGESTKGEEHVAPAEFDLDTLLETSNDANADEINELLGKAENNEAIDEGIAALLSGDSENLVPDFENQEPELSPTEKKAKEKAEKAEAKRKAKEAKAEAKRKAKEEKAAAKLAKKKGVAPKANDVVDNPSDNNEFNEGVSVNAEAGPVDDLSDVMSLLAGADVPLGDGEISEKHSAIPSNFTSDDGEVNITENSIGFDEFSGNDFDFNPI